MEKISDGKLIENDLPSYYIVVIELVVNLVDSNKVEDVHDVT